MLMAAKEETLKQLMLISKRESRTFEVTYMPYGIFEVVMFGFHAHCPK